MSSLDSLNLRDVDALIDACRAAGTLFEDEAFPAAPPSIAATPPRSTSAGSRGHSRSGPLAAATGTSLSRALPPEGMSVGGSAPSSCPTATCFLSSKPISGTGGTGILKSSVFAGGELVDMVGKLRSELDVVEAQQEKVSLLRPRAPVNQSVWENQ